MKHVKTRRIFLLASAVTTVMGIAVSCSFPEPELVADPDGSIESGSDAAEDAEIDAKTDAVADGGQPDAVELDAPLPFDATSDKPEVDAPVGCCDCDNDGYLAKDAGAQCADSGKPGGDCDDLDPRANPDAGFVHDLPTQDTKGDWNCDGKYTLQYQLKLQCSNSSSLIVDNCSDINGFQAEVVGCGVESATWVSCKAPVVAGPCGTGASEIRKQGCK